MNPVDQNLRCAHCHAPLAQTAVWQDGQAYCCSGCAGAARLLGEGAESVGSVGAGYVDMDRAEVMQRVLVGGRQGRVLHAQVEDLRCASCVRVLEHALRALPGVLALRIDAVGQRAEIEFDPDRVALSQVLAAAAAAGHRLHPDGVARDQAALRQEQRSALLRLGLTLILCVQGMMFVEALYYGAQDAEPAVRDAFRWLALLCTAPVVLYGGAPFLRAGLAQWRARAPGMDLLVSLSIWLAFGSSLWMTWAGIPGPIYLDAALMFVGLLSVARHLEAGVRRRASAQLLALQASDQRLHRIQRAGRALQVHAAGLEIGDTLTLEPGAEVPADGVVLAQAAEVSEAMLTGESMPVHKPVGHAVLAGTRVLGRELRMEVRQAGTTTVRAQLAQRVAQAAAERPPLARWGERLAAVFVWWMLGLAAVAGLVWAWMDPAQALPVTLAVLAGGCPCALALAIPAASAAAHGRLLADGLLVLRPAALQALAQVDQVVFDKTGTLTEAAGDLPATTRCSGMSVAQALGIAAALEREASHPVARMLAPFDTGLPVHDRQAHALGVSGVVEGRRWRIGRADYAAGEAAVPGQVLLVALDAPGVRATLLWEEQLKPDAAAVLSQLRALGLQAHLLSGDALARALRVAQALGLDPAQVHGGADPAAKLAAVQVLRQSARGVLMVGDGHNDAPTLAGADVSIALASGAEAARQAADLVLCSPHLGRIAEAVALARKLQRVCRQSLGWAVAYNLAMVPPAVLGWLSPAWAALGMSLSSLLVLGNALRLRRVSPTRRLSRPTESSPLQPLLEAP